MRPQKRNSRESAYQVFEEMSGHQEANASHVLHVTVSHVLYPVTEEVLHQVFDAFGAEKVYVLGRTGSVKVLILFQSCHDATRAREALHGRCIYDNCCWLDIRHEMSLQTMGAERKTVTPNYKYPMICLPSGNMNDQENGRGVELPPQFFNGWVPVNDKRTGHVKQQEQDDQKAKQFPWTKIGMPAGYVEPKQEAKQLETEENQKVPKEEKQKGTDHQDGMAMEGKKGKRKDGEPLKAKHSKLPPVCLRVDSLPRKRSGNGSSRSPSPPKQPEAKKDITVSEVKEKSPDEMKKGVELSNGTVQAAAVKHTEEEVPTSVDDQKVQGNGNNVDVQEIADSVSRKLESCVVPAGKGVAQDALHAWQYEENGSSHAPCKYGPRVMVRSVKPINRGDEVCIAYIDLLQTKGARSLNSPAATVTSPAIEDLDDNVLHNQFALCSNPDVSQNSYKTVAEGMELVECNHLVVSPVNGVNCTSGEDMLANSHDVHSGAVSVDGIEVQHERLSILTKMKELFVLRQQAELSSPYPVDSSPAQYISEETLANASLSNHPFGSTVEDNSSCEQHDMKAELLQIVTGLTKKAEALETSQLRSDQEIFSLKEVIKDSGRQVQQLEYNVDELQFKFDSSLCIIGSVCDNLDKPSIFLIGGYNGVTWLSSLDSFSSKKGMLVPLTPMGSARSNAAVAVWDGCLFVFGGGVIRQTRQESEAVIKMDSSCAEDDCIITVSAKECFEDYGSPTIHAVVHVQPRCSGRSRSRVLYLPWDPGGDYRYDLWWAIIGLGTSRHLRREECHVHGPWKHTGSLAARLAGRNVNIKPETAVRTASKN